MLKNKTLLFCVLLLPAIASSSQTIEKLKLTASGIAPISLHLENVKANDIFINAMDITKAYCGGLCSISSEENKSIQVEAVQQDAFKLSDGAAFFIHYDIKFVLVIKIIDGEISFEYRIGPTFKHSQTQPSKLTYLDLFNKDGSVRYAESLKGLEVSINALPMGIYEHIKKNYVPQLVSNEHERGYLKGNAKYSVWQYYNSKKQVELVINHTTGKIMYQIPDSSNYIVFKDGGWNNSKLDIRPMPIGGLDKLYSFADDELPYRAYQKCQNLGSKTASLIFEVDTLGKAVNWVIKNGFGSSCDSTILTTFQEASKEWIPSVLKKQTVRTRLVIPIAVDSSSKVNEKQEIDLALKGVDATPLQTYFLKIPKKDDRVFTFVEHSAEPVGGLTAFYMWVGKNLRYPAHARRMGLEGKVFVKFVIEPTGEVTNVEIVKGFNGECDMEAQRVMSISPKWKPGTQRGRPVRQAYTLPISFKLAE